MKIRIQKDPMGIHYCLHTHSNWNPGGKFHLPQQTWFPHIQLNNILKKKNG